MLIIYIGIALIVLCAFYLLYVSLYHKRRQRAIAAPQKETITKDKEIYLAGGCFWGVQKYFSQIPGVTFTETGYANGRGEQPTYEQVCSGKDYFAETVHILYDNSVVTLSRLLDMYYKVIDPTSINQQGNDIGIQYRTGIYYSQKEDLPVIRASLNDLQKSYEQPVVIQVEKLKNFYTAETYHQDYLDKNPNGYCHIPSYKFQQAKEMRSFQKLTKEELKQKLDAEQYAVTMENATEKPYRNAYWDTFEEGIYVDITTGEPLFSSASKFASSCGWPSFTKPIQPHKVQELHDHTHGMERIEVRSKLGDAHLGHVFPDGPKEDGGLRYCINSASLRFIPKEDMEQEGYGAYLSLLEK